MKKPKGSSYVFIIVVMTVITIMISTSLNISIYHMVTTNAYKKDSNNYYIALLGAEKVLNMINNNFQNNLYNIKKETTKTILYENLEEISYYKIDDFQNKYNGDFHLKQKDTTNKIGDKDTYYKEAYIKAINYFTELYLADKKSFSYEVELSEEDFNKYTVYITISKNLNIENEFKVLSKAKNLGTNNSITLEGKLKIKDVQNEEIIYETYNFKNILEWFNYPMYIKGLVVKNNSTILGEYSENTNVNFSNIINNNVQLEDTLWSVEYPVIYSNELSTDIDISQFYVDEKPIPTIIINANENGHIKLSYSDANKNYFKGLIVSAGNIVINENIDIHLEGNVFCGNSVYLENTNLNLIKNTNLIFDINTEQISDKRKILDKFNITSFNEMLELETSKNGVKIEKILNNAKININSIMINNDFLPIYIYNNLKQVD